jgi:MFS family permease
MLLFSVLWAGQLVSLVGSGLTEFALGVHVYQRTGSVAQFALISLSLGLPHALVSPRAGTLADRCDRRWLLILTDSLSGLTGLAIAVLLIADRLEVWHVYASIVLISTFDALQWPAFSSIMTILVPKEHLGRANGMLELGWAGGRILAPLLAGTLLTIVPLQVLSLIDVGSYVIAVSAVLLLRLPKLEPAVDEDAQQEASGGSWLRSVAYGWTYIRERPGLLGMLGFFVICNFALGFVQTLYVPMVLKFESVETLGTLESIGSLGILVSGVLMLVWGGPKRRVHGVLGFGLLFGCGMLLIGLRPSVLTIGLASFIYYASQPIINGAEQAIWQAKVPLDVQGRVLATRRAIEMSAGPIAYLLAGPLADGVFEPWLAPDSPLSATVGQVTGVGPGRGIGLLFVLLGLVPVVAAIWGYLSPRVRLIEDELPDALLDEDDETPTIRLPRPVSLEQTGPARPRLYIPPPPLGPARRIRRVRVTASGLRIPPPPLPRPAAEPAAGVLLIENRLRG